MANSQRFIQKYQRLPHGQVGLQEPLSKGHPETEAAVVPRPADNQDIAIPTMAAFSIHHWKRAAQNLWWTMEIIPQLVQPYLSLIRETKNLTVEPAVMQEGCSCLELSRILSVIIVWVFGKFYCFFPS